MIEKFRWVFSSAWLTMRRLYLVVETKEYYRSNGALALRTEAKLAAFMILTGLALCAAAVVMLVATMVFVYPTYMLAFVAGSVIGIIGVLVGKHVQGLARTQKKGLQRDVAPRIHTTGQDASAIP